MTVAFAGLVTTGLCAGLGAVAFRYMIKYGTYAFTGFADYAVSMGRPWYLSAWSACLGTSEHLGADNYLSDLDASLHVTDMLDLAAGQPIVDYQPFGHAPTPAAGFSFWNLGNQAPTTCEIGPTYTPASFAALTDGAR